MKVVITLHGRKGYLSKVSVQKRGSVKRAAYKKLRQIIKRMISKQKGRTLKES